MAVCIFLYRFLSCTGTMACKMLPGALIIILLLGAGAKAQSQQNPQELFDKANDQLQHGKTRLALHVYKQLVHQNQVSGALYLNIGLSYTRVDSMGRAKYYFLKARQFEETNRQASQALSYVNDRFSHQSAVLPTLPWQLALEWLANKVGAVVLLAIGLILLNVALFYFIIPWFTKNYFAGRRWGSAAILFVGIMLVLLSFLVHYREQRYHKAVMVYKKTTVRKKPNLKATMVSTAYEGYSLRADLYKTKGGKKWTYVRMSNGQYGWIPTNQIMIL